MTAIAVRTLPTADPHARLGRKVTVLLAASALMAVPSAGQAEAHRAATPPGITLLSATGSGCKPNTVAAASSVDRTAITITYSAYAVTPGRANQSVSKNCLIDLRIDPVPGYAPTITSVDYRGFASLARGSAAQMTASYTFRGTTQLRRSTMRLAGPYSDGWATTDAAAKGLVMGSCRGPHVLNLDSTLTLKSAATGLATDLVTMDSTDAVVPSTYRLSWKRCP